jgi:hypothetical protein
MRVELDCASHMVKKPWAWGTFASQRRKWEVGAGVTVGASSAADHATVHAAGNGRLRWLAQMRGLIINCASCCQFGDTDTHCAHTQAHMTAAPPPLAPKLLCLSWRFSGGATTATMASCKLSRTTLTLRRTTR